jgi:tRNA (guanine-N7-)-methyltransferase
MELRTQVLDYVISRIAALRSQHPSASPSSPGPYQNISALRTNTMKFLPNYFSRGQLSHLFICFPDPHFKARKHKARIVSAQLNAEYAFAVRAGGCVYTITDVEELHGWIVEHFEDEGRAGAGRELWERVEVDGKVEVEGGGDVMRCVKVMREETEEGKKVERNGGRKLVAVWRRKEDPGWVD